MEDEKIHSLKCKVFVSVLRTRLQLCDLSVLLENQSSAMGSGRWSLRFVVGHERFDVGDDELSQLGSAVEFFPFQGTPYEMYGPRSIIPYSVLPLPPTDCAVPSRQPCAGTRSMRDITVR